MQKELRFGNTVIPYELTRKRVKNINLRVKRDGSVAVSASLLVPEKTIEDFLLSKVDFICKARAYYRALAEMAPPVPTYADGDTHLVLGERLNLVVREGKRSHVERSGASLLLTVKDGQSAHQKEKALTTFRDKLCEDTVTALCHAVYPLFRNKLSTFPTLRFRHMRSRWGSCCPKSGVLTFSYALGAVAPALIEYVVMHEFTHFLHADHSPRFYAALASYMPDYKERRTALRKYR